MLVVAEGYRWAEYPGLRPGRIAMGLGDVARHPRGACHLVVTDDAVTTVCGLPRSDFPHTFPDSSRPESLCRVCVA